MTDLMAAGVRPVARARRIPLLLPPAPWAAPPAPGPPPWPHRRPPPALRAPLLGTTAWPHHPVKEDTR
ncbi:hypothetical protein STXM2123_1718 [Streptomyces sp. F-3]|nr:hypothetical protein STXM2123_1718 [Streptomyces sp. F-3]